MKQSKRIEAEPCPFCGGEDIDFISSLADTWPMWVWVECDTCGARTRAFAIPLSTELQEDRRKKQAAINNWNTRVNI